VVGGSVGRAVLWRGGGSAKRIMLSEGWIIVRVPVLAVDQQG